MPQYTLVDLTIKQDASVKELESLLPGSQSLVNDLLVQISSDLQKEAYSAFQTTVPVYTRQLRDSMILSSSSTSRGFKVYVSAAKHTNTYFIGGARGRQKPTGAELARILDEGYQNGHALMRRKNAIPASGDKLLSLVPPRKGESTAGWIDRAFEGFERNLDGI